MSEFDRENHEGAVATLEHVERGLVLARTQGIIDAATEQEIRIFADSNQQGAWQVICFMFQSRGQQISLEDVGLGSGSDCISLPTVDLEISADVRAEVLAIARVDPSLVDIALLRQVAHALKSPAVTPELIERILAFGVQHGALAESVATGMRMKAFSDLASLIETYEALKRDVRMEVDFTARVRRQLSLLEREIPIKGEVNLVQAFTADRLVQIVQFARHILSITQAPLHTTNVAAALLDQHVIASDMANTQIDTSGFWG